MKRLLFVTFWAASLWGQADSPGKEAGIPAGAAVPAFEAVDQNGKQRNFDSIAGPQGVVLVFFRSADW